MCSGVPAHSRHPVGSRVESRCLLRYSGTSLDPGISLEDGHFRAPSRGCEKALATPKLAGGGRKCPTPDSHSTPLGWVNFLKKKHAWQIKRIIPRKEKVGEWLATQTLWLADRPERHMGISRGQVTGEQTRVTPTHPAPRRGGEWGSMPRPSFLPYYDPRQKKIRPEKRCPWEFTKFWRGGWTPDAPYKRFPGFPSSLNAPYNKYNKSQNASSNRCSKAVAVLFCLAGGDMADDDGPRVKAGGVGQHGRHLHRVAHGHL